MSRALLLSPHADDEVLFAAFTVIRYRPDVVICCPSVRDYGSTAERHWESQNAGNILHAASVEQWAYESEDELAWRLISLDQARHRPLVFAPSEDCSHPDHRMVGSAAARVFGGRLFRFHTYNATGKVRRGTQVAFEPAWVQLKLRALAMFTTQLEHPRAHKFFMEDLHEYYEVPAPGDRT